MKFAGLGSSINVKSSDTKKLPCRCGHNHPGVPCKFKEATCHRCGKVGHIAPVCRSKKKVPGGVQKTSPFPPGKATIEGKTDYLPAEQEDLLESDPMHNIHSANSTSSPIRVSMEVNQKPLEFEEPLFQ